MRNGFSNFKVAYGGKETKLCVKRLIKSSGGKRKSFESWWHLKNLCEEEERECVSADDPSRPRQGLRGRGKLYMNDPSTRRPLSLVTVSFSLWICFSLSSFALVLRVLQTLPQKHIVFTLNCGQLRKWRSCQAVWAGDWARFHTHTHTAHCNNNHQISSPPLSACSTPPSRTCLSGWGQFLFLITHTLAH